MALSSAPCPVCAATAQPSAITLAGYRIFACPACRMHFAPDAYDAEADYEAIYQSEEYEQNQVQALEQMADPKRFARIMTYRPFFERVPQKAGATVLDVGCGAGRFAVGAAANSWKVTGIDVSARAIAVAKRFADFPLQVMTLDAMLATGQRFDAATAFEVLEHLRDPVGFLREMKQAVHPGGDILCTMPNWDCAPLQGATRPDWVPPVHLNFFTQGALEKAAEQAGLSNIVTGLVLSEAKPRSFGYRRLKWTLRRLRRRPNLAWGIWLHAKAP